MRHRCFGLAVDRRLQVERAAADLAAERQTDGPRRRLQHEREHLLLGDRADRRLDHQLVVAVKHDRPGPARLGANDGGGQQVARCALNDVFHQRAEPRPRRLPLSLRLSMNSMSSPPSSNFLLGTACAPG